MTMNVSERQVALRKGGNFSGLTDFLDGRIIRETELIDADMSVSAVQFVLLDSAEIGAGYIAKGNNPTAAASVNGGVLCAALVGAVGTAATTIAANAEGQVLNKVSIVDSVTRQPILVSGQEVHGLLQCSNTVTDGDAIGADASENVQMSFVVINEDGTYSLVSLTDTIDFSLSKCFSRRNLPTIYREGMEGIEVLNPPTVEPLVRKYVVTAAFAANEVITVSTGAGAGTGTSTPTQDTISSLGVDAATFNTTDTTRVRDNGVQATKSVDVVWDSATTFHFTRILDIGDRFEIEVAGS